MKDVSKHAEQVLFVSHNMSAVTQLCSKGIMLKMGRIQFQGFTPDVIEKYLSNNTKDSHYRSEMTVRNRPDFYRKIIRRKR
jgi:lipopolysaccharide transport system ATP-binding protein